MELWRKISWRCCRISLTLKSDLMKRKMFRFSNTTNYSAKEDDIIDYQIMSYLFVLISK